MTEATDRVGEQRPRRFPPYPDYKESGVQWLGEVPASWDIAPVYARYEVALGKMLDAKRVTGESSGKYLRNVDVQWDAVNIRGLPEMDFPPSDRDRYLLRRGDLLVCEGGEVGRTAIWGGELDECFYQKAIHRVRPWSACDVPRFFYFLMYAMAKRGVFTAGGNPNTIDHLTAVQLRRYRVPIPAAGEQRAIVAFLDRETAKIDALVARKERLIELLQEKRTTLITRAVTRGLGPNVSMKNSGVEWLGDIPAHWEILALGRVTISRCDGPFGSGLKSEHYSESGIRVVRLQNIGWADFIDSDAAYLDEAYARRLGDHRVQEDDVLVAGLGDDGHPVGRACVAPVEIEPAMVKADCFRFRLDRQMVLPRYVAFQLSATASAVAGSHATGATRTRMNLAASARRKIALPPPREQQAIAVFLVRETAKIDTLVAKVHQAIDHLKEFRTALISAAVTGKIDVRRASCDKL